MRTAPYLVGLLLILSGPLAAQSTTQTATVPAAAATPSDEQLHQELRDLKKVMEEALNNRDVDAILAHVDEQVVFTTMNGDVVTGRDGVRAYFDKMMNGPAKVVESIRASFLPDTLSILRGGDVAISWGRTDDHYELSTGQNLAIAARWSATMVRRDGRWLIANFHYSTNMFDNPVLSAQRTLLIGSGVGGALVLGLVGFLLGRRRRGG